MSEHPETFDISLTLEEDFRFRVDFGQPGVPDLRVDEPEPLGDGEGPNASRLLAAAVGNCLSASALFCLRKAKVDVAGMRTEVHTELVRNEDGRLRIGKIDVSLHPEFADGNEARIARCLDLFEDFCLVTESVRSGIEVDVEVHSDAGEAQEVAG